MSDKGYTSEYEELILLLNQNGIPRSPANIHGKVCGYLTVGVNFAVEDWLGTLARDLSLDEPLHGEAAERILQLVENSSTELMRRDFSFQLVLPDDDTPMGERSWEIGQWCDGYIDSLRAMGDERMREASDEAAELIADLEQMSEISDDGDESEETEMDFIELVEYVRLAAIDLFEEFNSD